MILYNGKFHLSPHENIFTIALINIHYLYNICSRQKLYYNNRTEMGNITTDPNVNCQANKIIGYKD